MAGWRPPASSSSTTASTCCSTGCPATDLLVGGADLFERLLLFGGGLVSGGLGLAALRARQRGAGVVGGGVSTVAVQVELHLAVVVCAVIGRDERCGLRTGDQALVLRQLVADA